MWLLASLTAGLVLFTAVVLAGDWLTVIVFWESMAVSSMLLILHGGRPASHAASMRYLFVHVVGGSLMLGGILWQVGETGSIAFGHLDGGPAAWLTLAGVAVNAAVVPLHAWLTDAYPESSVTGMVFLGAFTTKTAVYVLLRAFSGWEVLIIAGVIVFPWLFTLYMSTQDWKIGGGPEFVGLQNFAELFRDARFIESMGHTFYYTVLAVVLPILFGTAAALVFHREFPFRGLLRTIFVMPMMATPVAVALVWTMMFHPQLGVLNYLLSLVGIGPQAWVYSPGTVIPTLIMVEVWHWTPLVMLIVLGGLAGLPRAYGTLSPDIVLDMYVAAAAAFTLLGATLAGLLRHFLLMRPRPAGQALA